MTLPRIKGILLDIDGTLVNSQGVLTPATHQILTRLQAAGIKVGLCTGRNLPTIKKYFFPKFAAQAWHVVDDGATLVTNQGQVISQQLLPAALVQKLAQLVADLGGEYGFSDQKQVFFTPLMLARVSKGDFWQKELAPVTAITNWQTSSLGLYNLTAPMETAISAVLSQESTVAFHRYFHRDGNPGEQIYYLVKAVGVSKASGAQHWADHFHLNLAEVMMIGDSENDQEVLAAVGWGVAMGNATAEIKAQARQVIGTNDEDGVAKYLTDYFFNH